MKKTSVLKASAPGSGLALSAQASAQIVNPAKDEQIESHVKAFLNAVISGGVQPIEQLTPAEGRAALAGFQSSVKVDLSGVTVTERTIGADGQSIKINIVKPGNVNGILPAFMFFHGGGWVLGDFPTHERFVRDLVMGRVQLRYLSIMRY